MCGRFASLLSPELLADLFKLPLPPVLEARYNIAPTQPAPVVRNQGDHNRLDLLRWGLVPEGSKDPSYISQLINTRSESVTEKPAFRHAIKYRRCIIPVSGFFEWEHTGVQKQPYYIQLADHS